MDSLEKAFTNLIKHLDPEVDEYTAAESFRSMTWPPSELVTDFLARYFRGRLEEGKAAQLQPKQICRFMITQLPQETQAARMVRSAGYGLAEGGSLKMTAEIRKALLYKGIPLDNRYRDIGSEKVFQIGQAKEELPEEQRVVQSDEDEQVASISKSHVKGRGKVEPKHPEPKCFGCGEQGHIVRTCLDKKKCASCGRWA